MAALSSMPASAPDISVIIPTLNEEGRVGEAVERTLAAGVGDVIVVDGGSTDRTVAIGELAGARVLQSTPGRGTQQNVGARAARGRVLLFLHADTKLPATFPRLVRETLAAPRVAAGAFRFQVDAPGRSLRLIERIVDWRSRYLQTPYGDQALFLTREMFETVGGFPDIPLLEDYALIRRLKREGRIALADGSALTSARRWSRLGVLRTTWTNNLCLLAYWSGVNPERIARWRGSL